VNEGTSVATARPLAPEGARSPTRRFRGVADWPWAVILVGGLSVVGIIRLALSLHGTYSSGGDVAFLELQIRQVLHGEVSLGPYSRYGWHHPGPLVFYLYAPLYWLTGESSRSLFLSSWVLNSAGGLGAVLVARRRFGEGTARLVAAGFLVYVYCAGFTSLIDPWNPSLLPMPMLFLMVCAAAGAAGSAWGVAGALVAASFLIQTHIATTLLAGVLVLVAIGGYVHSRFAGAGRAGAGLVRKGLLLWVLPLAVIWAAPLAQQVTASNGNLTTIAHFYLHPPASAGPSTHTVRQALQVVSDYSTVVPAGPPAVGDVGAHAGRLLWASALAVIGVAVAVAWRRRSKFMAWLSLLTPLGMAVATLSALRAIGPYYGYLFFWCQTLALPALIALGALVFDYIRRPATHRRRSGRLAPLAGAAGLLVVTGLAVSAVTSPPTNSVPDSPTSRAVAARIEQIVGSRQTVFTVDVVQQDFADGALVLELAKDGYRFRMSPEMDLYDGDTSQAAVGPVVELEDVYTAPPEVLPGTHVMSLGNLELWVVPVAS
jgi:hypothetical protein